MYLEPLLAGLHTFIRLLVEKFEKLKRLKISPHLKTIPLRTLRTSYGAAFNKRKNTKTSDFHKLKRCAIMYQIALDFIR